MRFGFEGSDAESGAESDTDTGAITSVLAPASGSAPVVFHHREPRRFVIPAVVAHDTVVEMCKHRLSYGIVLAVSGGGLAAVLFVERNPHTGIFSSQAPVRSFDVRSLIKAHVQIHVSDVVLASPRHVPSRWKPEFCQLQNTPRADD